MGLKAFLGLISTNIFKKKENQENTWKAGQFGAHIPSVDPSNYVQTQQYKKHEFHKGRVGLPRGK